MSIHRQIWAVCFASMVTGKKGKSLIPDPKSLASEHHMVFVSCLGFLATKSISPSNPLKVLVVGLGGGSLPRFIDQHLSNVRACVVLSCRSMGTLGGGVLPVQYIMHTCYVCVWCSVHR